MKMKMKMKMAVYAVFLKLACAAEPVTSSAETVWSFSIKF